MERFRFSDRETGALRGVQVGIPWNRLPEYFDAVLSYRINPEIGFGALELDSAGRAECERIAGMLRERNCRVTLHGPFWDLCPGSVDPRVREVASFRLRQFMDVAEIFHPIQVVCHTGYDFRHHGFERSSWVDRSLAVWAPLVERAERMGACLLLENVWEEGPELHQELFARIASPRIGFCLDVGHQNSFSSTPLPVWLDVLADFIREVHLHDNDGSRDHHLPIGRGSIDFDLLFRRLRSNREFPILTLEPHTDEDFAETTAAFARIASSAAFLGEGASEKDPGKEQPFHGHC